MNGTDAKFQVTRKSAAAILKKASAGSTFNVHVSGDAPIEGDPGRVFPGVLRGFVSISRAQAIKLVSGMLTDVMEERGARIPLSIYTPENNGLTRPRSHYWIG